MTINIGFSPHFLVETGPKMIQKTAHKNQANLFYGSLLNMLDANDPLVALSDAIDWNRIENGLDKYYHQSNGRPSKPIRLMAGLLMLKQLENLSDDEVPFEGKVLSCNSNAIPTTNTFAG